MDILSENPNVIYQFWTDTEATTAASGKEKLIHIVRLCELFADSIGIRCMCDSPRLHNGRFSIRIQFQIEAPQYEILTKVAALFNFAACGKLYFTNQFFLSK